jgi:hypothetical protein
MLFFLADHRQLNEVMIPFTRINLLAFLVHRGCNHEFDNLYIVHDGFRRKIRGRHLFHQFANGFIGDFGKQLFTEVRQKPCVQGVPPTRNRRWF